MNEPVLPTSAPLPWKRIIRITLWIWGFSPVGLWMLWKEPQLNRSQKIRVGIYALGSLVLLTILFVMYEISSLQKALTAAGVDY